MISASGSTESLSSQWQRKGKKRGGEKRRRSADKGELKAEWSAGVGKIDKERVGERKK